MQCDNAGVQPNSLIELAKRALALTVHQLALYRKVGGRWRGSMHACHVCFAGCGSIISTALLSARRRRYFRPS